MCLGNDQVSCTPLCPITGAECEGDETAVEVTQPHAKYPQCLCPMMECMKNMNITEDGMYFFLQI